jgi:quercetin dioxygenase-like cupin family protein
VELDVRQPLVLPPGTGAKLLSDELTVTEWSGAASATPHIHRAHVDAFYVVDGTLEFAGTTLARDGLGYAPPGIVHWFDARAGRYLNIHAPGGAWARRVRARHERRRPTDDEIDSFDAAEGSSPPPSLVLPDEGEALVDDRRTLRIKAALPELCVFTFDARPGYVGPTAHVHRGHVDAFYVLEGELEFELDGERVPAPAGTWVAAMPGVAHTFRNARDARVRFLNLHAPGMQFDEYLRRQQAGEDGRRFHESFDVYEFDAE